MLNEKELEEKMKELREKAKITIAQSLYEDRLKMIQEAKEILKDLESVTAEDDWNTAENILLRTEKNAENLVKEFSDFLTSFV